MSTSNNEEVFAAYLRRLRKFATADKTEHSDRGALEELLNAFAARAERGTTVQHEPKRVADKGAPDFKVSKTGMILGYVENKAIGENVTKVLKSEQIAKYKTLSQNIVVTDYLQFAWINKDGTQRETLCHESDLENPKFKLRDDRIAAVSALLEGFRPRRKALAARSNWRSRSPQGAGCYAIIWARSWSGRTASIRRGGSSASTRPSAIRCFTNSSLASLLTPSRRCWLTACSWRV